ncbi:MAG: hypothetical protein LLG01_14610 [Planctomycetaceae bacterium]|nr:hypothetical protein [Planctomycetaceae bacterium]
MPDPAKTALHDKHVEAGAAMSDVDGFLMPLHYGDATGEAAAAQTRAAVFDISSIGRIRIKGSGAVDLLERLCTADASHQEDDTSRLTLLCDAAGKIIDICMIARLEDEWLLTCSPSRRGAVMAHLDAQAGDFDVKIKDTTDSSTMLWLCGPQAGRILDGVLPEKVSPLKRGQGKSGSYVIAKYVATRTGLTKLWSLEVIFPNLLAGQAWRFITQKAGDNAIKPAGTQARDALRTQANLPAWGAGIDENTNPFAAGLARAIDFNHNFLGRAALEKLSATPTPG